MPSKLILNEKYVGVAQASMGRRCCGRGKSRPTRLAVIRLITHWAVGLDYLVDGIDCRPRLGSRLTVGSCPGRPRLLEPHPSHISPLIASSTSLYAPPSESRASAGAGRAIVARAPVWPLKPIVSGLNFDAQA